MGESNYPQMGRRYIPPEWNVRPNFSQGEEDASHVRSQSPGDDSFAKMVEFIKSSDRSQEPKGYWEAIPDYDTQITQKGSTRWVWSGPGPPDSSKLPPGTHIGYDGDAYDDPSS
jgi:hypothetical protein